MAVRAGLTTSSLRSLVFNLLTFIYVHAFWVRLPANIVHFQCENIHNLTNFAKIKTNFKDDDSLLNYQRFGKTTVPVCPIFFAYSERHQNIEGSCSYTRPIIKVLHS
jgi:hypothetical protein